MKQSGMDCVLHHAEQLFHDLQRKYEEYDISHEPFLVVKADSGTYGMAVMTVRHLDELKNLNRKERTRMSTIKGGQTVDRVIIQEGVYTFETIGEEKAVAEPVVYLFGEQVIGGFYRVHNKRGIDENLNAPGMHFKPMAFSYACREPCAQKQTNTCENRYYAYGVIARLSMLAAAYEMKELM
jgi:glutamate--cysteine ligase